MASRKMVEQPLLSRLNWKRLRKEIREEIRAREDDLPVVSTYRWWARRPGRLFGAILDVAGMVRVADPFGGGGTVAVEAARRGLPVYVQELYPWPVFGLSTALTPIDPDMLAEAGQWLLNALEPLRKPYMCPDGRELSHILWVRWGCCPHCGSELALLADPMISLASRRAHEDLAYYGCPACGGIWTGSRGSPPRRCPLCGKPLHARIARGRIRCPHCEESAPRSAFLEGPPQWRPVLAQEIRSDSGRLRAVLRPISPSDPARARPASEVFPQTREPIPPGIETNRLLRAGFRFWGDLYTDRQAAVLLEGLRTIAALESPVRDYLALALLGTAEMAAFLARWERFHPKAVEALAHHRYAHTTLTVETNLLSPIGRGTLPKRLHALRKMAEWALRELGPQRSVHVVWNPSGRLRLETGIHVACGSSVRMALQNGSVDLVLTDPPYHDDIQYGELARLLHFWLRRYRDLPEANASEEATPNSGSGRDPGKYAEILRRCFLECRRVLRPGGRLVFTFRNRELRAWRMLCEALHQAGFRIHALMVVRTDEILDPTRRESCSLRHDLILECMGREIPVPAMPFHRAGANAEEKALLAAGLAMAEALRKDDPVRFPDLFQKWRRRLGIPEGAWIR